MPITTSVDIARGLVVVTVSGPWPTIDELRVAQVALQARAEELAGLPVLFDFREVVGRLPDYVTAEAQVMSVGTSQLTKRRRACLVKSDAQFGISRMFSSISDLGNATFRDEAEAVAWLLGSEPPPP